MANKDTAMSTKPLSKEEWEKASEQLAKLTRKLDAKKEEHKLKRRSMRESENDIKSEIDVYAQQVESHEKQVPAQKDAFEDQ